MSPVRQRSALRIWFVRVALAVICGVALGLAIDIVRTGGTGAWFAQRGLPGPYLPLGSHVDIGGGRTLYLDCRGQGTPTVVLEAGAGSGASTWSAVHDELAATTRTCAYDRPGRGSSPPRGRHTLAETVADLRLGLERAGEPAPFVLVGHSHGGDYSRIFAAHHPDEVAGVVLVDTFDPDLETRWVHPLLGALRAEYEARLDGLRATVDQVEDLDWPASEQQLRESTMAGIPIEVLRAPRAEPRLDTATNEAIAAAAIAAYESLSPGSVRYELAWGAGHMIQIDRPDLVIAATRRLVEAARAGTR